MKWLSGRLAKERKIVEDALARKQESKTGSIEKAAKETENSGESCSSPTKQEITVLDNNAIRLASRYFLN